MICRDDHRSARRARLLNALSIRTLKDNYHPTHRHPQAAVQKMPNEVRSKLNEVSWLGGEGKEGGRGGREGRRSSHVPLPTFHHHHRTTHTHSSSRNATTWRRRRRPSTTS